MVGRTGAGKSTLAEMLFGDLSALECIPDPEFATDLKLVNSKDPETRGNELTSNTICPQLFTDPMEPNVAIYDCPGFADTRGLSNEIATGLFLGNIVKHAEKVKIAVIVGHEAVQPRGDRKLFTENVLPEVLDFVNNSKIYQGGVFLLVNKHNNPNGEFPEDEEIKTIAQFLKQVQDLAHTLSSSDEKWRKRRPALDALFQGSLLVQTEDGKYPNIRFIKKVTSKGQLKDMPDIKECRIRIRNQLLDNPNFNFLPSCNPEDFGRPVSEAAKIEIRKTRSKLVGEAEAVLGDLAEKIKGQFIRSRSDKLELSRLTRCFANALDDLEDVEETEGGLSTATLGIRRFADNIQLNVSQELGKLEKIVSQLRFLGGVDIQQASKTCGNAHQKIKLAVEKMERDSKIHSGLLVMFPHGLVSV